MGKEFDIYSIIKTEEIREYFRQNRKFTILEQEQLIIHSYTSLVRKQEMLCWLRNKAIDGDKEKVNNMVSLYDEVIRDILSPCYRPLFIHQYMEPIYSYSEEDISDLFYSVQDCFGVYPRFEDLSRHLEEMKAEGEKRRYEKQSLAHIIKVLDNGKYSRGLTFTLIEEDGKYYPKDFIVNQEWLHEHNIYEETYQRKQDYISEYQLPYENGDHIKLVLPFWKRPIYGVFERYVKNGMVHQSFFLNGQEHTPGNELDMSYQDFELSSGYSVFDWVDRYFTGNVDDRAI